MKTLTVWASATLLISLGNFDALAMEGTGTEEDPYIIASLLDLQAIQDDPAASYVLGADIDAAETRTWNGGFRPMDFSGHLDGRDHSIYSLYINRPTGGNQGIFGSLSGAVIENVHLVDVDLTVAYTSGALAGGMHDSTVVRCSATGRMILSPGSGDAKSGGLVGSVGAGSHIDRCFSGVDVYADRRMQVGSLIGYLRGVEGIALLTNSYSYGSVFGNGAKQGNLLGDADGSEVDRCYSSGQGKALIGYNFRSPVITNSYWDKEQGASSSRYGGVPKTTVEMMQQSTFALWDFESIWEIVEGETYPYFIPRQPQPISPIPTLGTGALIALSLLLSGCGLVFLRKRKRMSLA